MKVFSRVFGVKNINDRIYKSIENYFVKIVFFDPEQIINVINFHILNMRNDGFYFTENLRTFHIENAAFFYKNSFFIRHSMSILKGVKH